MPPGAKGRPSAIPGPKRVSSGQKVCFGLCHRRTPRERRSPAQRPCLVHLRSFAPGVPLRRGGLVGFLVGPVRGLQRQRLVVSSWSGLSGAANGAGRGTFAGAAPTGPRSAAASPWVLRGTGLGGSGNRLESVPWEIATAFSSESRLRRRRFGWSWFGSARFLCSLRSKSDSFALRAGDRCGKTRSLRRGSRTDEPPTPSTDLEMLLGAS